MKRRTEQLETGSVERVQRGVRMLISRGMLLPGEQIRQEEMAEEFGVSRVPLREALTILADQGMLDHHLNRGYFVAKRVPEELHQLYRMLSLLEDELLEAMDWPTKDEITQLKLLNRKMAELAEGTDWADMISLNHQFHIKIFSLSRYKLIFREIERLWTMNDVYIAGKLALPEARLRTVQEHDKIVLALARKDQNALKRSFEAHRSNATADHAPRSKGGPKAKLGSRSATRKLPLRHRTGV